MPVYINQPVPDQYDVVIAGGGLAGLTLALQLKQSRPGISVLVLEKRMEQAPVAAHKVGESLSELGSSYICEILGLRDYLAENHLRKLGFRFFFSHECSHDIAKRVEVGSKIDNPYPAYQLDRGILENELVRRLQDSGVSIFLGSKITRLEMGEKTHTVRYEKDGREFLADGRWIVDATGRNGLLKKKLGLEKEINHPVNAAWFRLDAFIDIDSWSENSEWLTYLAPGRRRLATNHLMGEGYWVWLIPLISGQTSIGIVADAAYHPFTTFNTFEKAMNWLADHEPLAAAMLNKHKEKKMDFKVMKQFAYDCSQFYSMNRWAVTGEAGAFMDPLYSPGSDFIGLGNCWITELINRDLDKEDISLRALIYDLAHKELISGWMTLYKDMYGLFGKTRIMLMKILWDWASYWAIPNVMFINGGYTDLTHLKHYSSSSASIGRKFARLNDNMQQLFRSWGASADEEFSDRRFNVFDLNCLYQLQTELGTRYDKSALMSKIESNLAFLEHIAAEIFRMVSHLVKETPDNMNVDPYTMFLEDGKELLLQKSQLPSAMAQVTSVKNDIAKMWMEKIKKQENEFS